MIPWPGWRAEQAGQEEDRKNKDARAFTRPSPLLAQEKDE